MMASPPYQPLPHGCELEQFELQLPLTSRQSLDEAYFITQQLGSGSNLTTHGAYSMVFLSIVRPEQIDQPIRNPRLFVIKTPKRDQGHSPFTKERDLLARLTASRGSGRAHITPLVLSDTNMPVKWISMPLIRGCRLDHFQARFHTEFESHIPPVFIYHFFQQCCKIFRWLHQSTSGKPFVVAHFDVGDFNFLLDVSGMPSSKADDELHNHLLAKYLPKIVLFDFGFSLVPGEAGQTYTPSIDGQHARFSVLNDDIFAVREMLSFLASKPGTGRMLESDFQKNDKWYRDVMADTERHAFGNTPPLSARQLQTKYARTVVKKIRTEINAFDINRIRDVCYNTSITLPTDEELQDNYNQAMGVDQNA
jgi:serine/threonine protein kinase